MTARHDVLAAARSLAASGRNVFTPAQLIAEARRLGSTYTDATLRTHVTSHMCHDPAAVRGGRADLVRIERGRYRLNDLHSGDTGHRESSMGQDGPGGRTREAADVLPDPHDEWHWEGNVQAAVVRYLVEAGWDIVAVADTAKRQQGHDIVAEGPEGRLIVEVKGYPSTRHVGGARHGQPKRTHPATQARHWFAGAILSALLAVDSSPPARVVIALPNFDTYRNLAERTTRALAAAAISVWIVDAEGGVVAA